MMARRFMSSWRRDARVVSLLLVGIAIVAFLVDVAGRNVGWGPTLGSAVLISAIAAFLFLSLLLREERAGVLDRVSKFAGVLAFAAAGSYFAFQLASGQLSSDLTLSIAAVRTPSVGKDWLNVTAVLKHERHASLRLMDAVAYIRHADGHAVPVSLLNGYYRRATDNEMLSKDQDHTKGRPKRPLLNAGDQVQLSAFTVVPSDQPVVVDVVVVAAVNIGYLNSEQWVSSVASVPLSPCERISKP